MNYWKGNCDIFKAVSSDSPRSQLSLMYIFSLVALSLQIISDAFDLVPLYFATSVLGMHLCSLQSPILPQGLMSLWPFCPSLTEIQTSAP